MYLWLEKSVALHLNLNPWFGRRRFLTVVNAFRLFCCFISLGIRRCNLFYFSWQKALYFIWIIMMAFLHSSMLCVNCGWYLSSGSEIVKNCQFFLFTIFLSSGGGGISMWNAAHVFSLICFNRPLINTCNSLYKCTYISNT